MIRLFKVSLVLFVSTVVHGYGQAPAVVNQPIQWLSVFANFKFAKHLSLYTDMHIRHVDDFQPMQNQYRVGLEYLVNDKISFIPIGYVYTRNFIYGAQPTTYENNERRIFQQFMIRHKAGRFRFFQRIRFEERFLQVHSKDAAGEVIDVGFGENFQFRFRYRFNATYPLGAESIMPKKFFLTAYDELFISRGEKVIVSYPDQNRLFAGAGYQFTKGISANAGYFYQIIIKPSGQQQENNMGALIQFFLNFDFTKAD